MSIRHYQHCLLCLFLIFYVHVHDCIHTVKQAHSFPLYFYLIVCLPAVVFLFFLRVQPSYFPYLITVCVGVPAIRGNMYFGQLYCASLERKGVVCVCEIFTRHLSVCVSE